MKRIVVLGSTGSIGTQTVDVVRQHSDELEIVGLAVNTRVGDMLAQARAHNVRNLAVGDERLADQAIASEVREQAGRPGRVGLRHGRRGGLGGVCPRRTWWSMRWWAPPVCV